MKSDLQYLEYKMHPHPLVDHILYRLARACSESEGLIRSLDNFFDGHAITLSKRLSGDCMVLEFYINDFDPNHFFLDFSEQVSGVFHKLRSSLDHLIAAAALLHDEGIDPGTRLYFPIYADPDGFERSAVKLKKHIAPEFIDVLRGLQPFNNPPTDRLDDDYERQKLNYLELLSRVVNKDKHWEALAGIYGVLESGVGVVPSAEISHLFKNGGTISFEAPSMTRVYPGSVVGRVRSVNPLSLDMPFTAELTSQSAIILESDSFPLGPSILGVLNAVMRAASEITQCFPIVVSDRSPLNYLDPNL
jgi:hypothetical protein